MNTTIIKGGAYLSDIGLSDENMNKLLTLKKGNYRMLSIEVVKKATSIKYNNVSLLDYKVELQTHDSETIEYDVFVLFAEKKDYSFSLTLNTLSDVKTFIDVLNENFKMEEVK